MSTTEEEQNVLIEEKLVPMVSAVDLVHTKSLDESTENGNSSSENGSAKVHVRNLMHENGSSNGNKMEENVDREVTLEDYKNSKKSEEQKDGNDEGDAWGFGAKPNQPRRPAGPSAPMPVHRESETYNMNHLRRGVAFIFNHMHFDPALGLKSRNGTIADRDNLRATLRSLDFEVRVFNDLPVREIDRLLEDCSLEDHTDADCILISVLSHGEMGILYASDRAYKPDRLWSHFNAERCPSLAGKPKLFFIQACQGDQLDSGVRLKPVATTETDSHSFSYKIPSHADFLICYSTIPGFYSWRNTQAGSWFIQGLCRVLEKESGRLDLLAMMTRVSRTVAFDFQSNTPGDISMHEKKQIPCITSMLTRDLYFSSKI